jgi:hypothetical protein
MAEHNVDKTIGEFFNNNDYRDYSNSYKPLVETGRKMIPLMKRPEDLDFTMPIGGTTYTVKSQFDKNANESMLRIVLRWLANSTDIYE